MKLDQPDASNLVAEPHCYLRDSLHPGNSLVENNKGVDQSLRTILEQIRKTPCCGIARTRVSSTRKTDVPKE